MPPPKTFKKSNTVMALLSQDRRIEDFYELRHQLGVGAAGKVYECINKETGIKWATKVIDIKNMSSWTNNNTKESIEKIISEATLLRSLRHPHIIHLEDIFADDRNLYLIMELSRGGDLFDRLIAKKRYSESESKQVIHKILDALVYLHDNKVAHRDIKPENILLQSLDSDIDIKLTDFGLAKVADNKNALKSFCGTPQYLSPEVLQRKFSVAGRGTYSFEADMWSIGILTFVLLSGSYPFNDETLYDQIEKASFDYNNVLWLDISNNAKDFINRLIVINPSNRLTAKQALNHIWFTNLSTDVSNSLTINNIDSTNRRYNTRSSSVMEISTSSYTDSQPFKSKSKRKISSIEMDVVNTPKGTKKKK
eukprot:gene18278-23955_t